MKYVITVVIVLSTVSLIAYGTYSLVLWSTTRGFVWYRGTQSKDVWFSDDVLTEDTMRRVTKKNGEDFTILLFSDTQLEGSPSNDKKVLELIDDLITTYNPSMVMTTGDNTSSRRSHFLAKKLVSQLSSYGIPWGVTLGNHDSEGMADRTWHGNLYENAENSLFSMGPSNIHGIGNYSILIEDEEKKPIYSLIMMDSNETRVYPDGKSSYDFIYTDQIDWYQWVVEGVDSWMKRPIPSMLFFHIPLPEFRDAYNAIESGEIGEGNFFGENREDVFAARMNTGLFQRVLDLGSTTHIFSGHDHVNNLSVLWQDVRLTYGLKTGPTSYWDKAMQGATLITIKDTTHEVVIEHIYK